MSETLSRTTLFPLFLLSTYCVSKQLALKGSINRGASTSLCLGHLLPLTFLHCADETSKRIQPSLTHSLTHSLPTLFLSLFLNTLSLLPCFSKMLSQHLPLTCPSPPSFLFQSYPSYITHLLSLTPCLAPLCPSCLSPLSFSLLSLPSPPSLPLLA